MIRRLARPVPVAVLGVALVAVAIGCAGSRSERGSLFGPRSQGSQRTPDELKASIGWLDPAAQEAGRSTLRDNDMLEFAEKTRAARKPEKLSPRKTVLMLSGGGSYGAYPAGVLVGWTAAGTRPTFDVVTGISTGALIGAFAFLGPAYDAELQCYYTTVTNDDIYKRRRLLAAVLSESFADTKPLERLIARVMTDERIDLFAEEYRKGRRYYVATTDFDARRGIVWDMGAIAARGTPESKALFRKVLLAAAAIPGFFPSVPIEVTVDGRPYIERHVDGGITSSMFFAPPWVPIAERPKLQAGWLHGSDVYVLVAGKMYPDPVPVKPRTVEAASAAVSVIIYDQTRSDLHKLFLLTIVTGMNYNVSVMPKELEVPANVTEFDPVAMTKMFNAGYEWAVAGPKWRMTPPGYEPGEGARYRAGTTLRDFGTEWPGQLSPEPGPGPGSVPKPPDKGDPVPDPMPKKQ